MLKDLLNVPDIYQAQGDTARPLETRLLEDDGFVDLTGADSVDIRIKSVETGLVQTSICEVLEPLTGYIRYVWPIGSTELPGDYLIQFVVTYPGDRKDTHPKGSKDSILLRRVPRLQ